MQLQGEARGPNSVVQNLRPSLALQTNNTTSSVVHLIQTTAAHIGLVATEIQIFKTEGFRALFLDPLFHHVDGNLRHPEIEKETNTMPLANKILIGLIAGVSSAVARNPANVAMVHMQADDRLPLSQRHNYTSVVDALARMTKQEGIISLWRG
ncbi:mitochondrial uncoupling protein 5-like [Gossypium australe]|uniref:Mitochondrial uncoupling protein 5-like n=1 Tax=Gossypium australe TaxID=47621 RepID=A0A5B6X1T3_9ROSI|nr:mitochondrial uncoupling protein 5-like [Gossypium australe]